MTACVQDIISVMEEIAPTSLAESWDNSGLQLGDRRWPVSRVMVSLDPTREVLTEACDKKIDMLITHHPMIFTPIKKLDLATPLGEMISTTVRNGIAIYSAHTNLDMVSNGLNDELARCLDLTHLKTLQPSGSSETDSEAFNGLGRIGDLEKGLELLSFCQLIKAKLGLESLRVSGKKDIHVKRVALCTGSGGSLLSSFFNSDADVYVTGDIKYHEARDAEEMGRPVIDIGHFGSEKIVIELLTRKLKRLLEKRALNVEVYDCTIEKDPFYTL